MDNFRDTAKKLHYTRPVTLLPPVPAGAVPDEACGLREPAFRR